MYESLRWYWAFGEPGGSIDDELLDRLPGSYVGMRKPMSWPSMPADGIPRRGSYRPSADDAAEGARRKTLDVPELKRLSFSLGFCQLLHCARSEASAAVKDELTPSRPFLRWNRRRVPLYQRDEGKQGKFGGGERIGGFSFAESRSTDGGGTNLQGPGAATQIGSDLFCCWFFSVGTAVPHSSRSTETHKRHGKPRAGDTRTDGADGRNKRPAGRLTLAWQREGVGSKGAVE